MCYRTTDTRDGEVDGDELLDEIRGLQLHADDMHGVVDRLREALDRAERPDRLGVGAGYGRLDPHEIEVLVEEMAAIAGQLDREAYKVLDQYPGGDADLEATLSPAVANVEA